MGRTCPAVRTAGARGAAAITAVTATAAVLLAGCGSRSADPPARGRPGMAATAAAVAAGPEAGREPAAGSRAGAQALARRLLSGLILPPGARPVRVRMPRSLRQPQIPDGGTHEADVHELLRLREPMTAVQQFLLAHVPGGMQWSGDGRGFDAGGTTMLSVSDGMRSPPAGIDSAEVDTAVVPAASGTTLLRADAAVIWYPARSAAERIDPARYRAAVVSITMFNPRRHTVTRAIASRRAVARLAGLANRLHAAPYQPMGCPAIVASFSITFVPAAGGFRRLVVTPSGCMTVGVAVAGAAQPPLWGDTGLIGAAKRLLRVRSLA
jgi:hypothetical protein